MAKITDADKLYVGRRNNLPDELCSRLNGDTLNELDEDAKNLKHALGIKAAIAPLAAEDPLPSHSKMIAEAFRIFDQSLFGPNN